VAGVQLCKGLLKHCRSTTDHYRSADMALATSNPNLTLNFTLNPYANPYQMSILTLTVTNSAISADLW